MPARPLSIGSPCWRMVTEPRGAGCSYRSPRSDCIRSRWKSCNLTSFATRNAQDSGAPRPSGSDAWLGRFRCRVPPSPFHDTVARTKRNAERIPMPTNRVYSIAVIPGDGIGKEVVPEGVRVLEAAAKKFGFELRSDHFDFASLRLLREARRMMPEDWKEKIGRHDAIFFGAVGWPAKIPDHISLWGSLILFRREFDQYVNLRPVRLMPGVPSPARQPQARRHRLLGRARKHRGRIFVDRRPHLSRHRARSRHAGDHLDAHRRRPRAEIRLRAGAARRRRSI